MTISPKRRRVRENGVSLRLKNCESSPSVRQSERHVLYVWQKELFTIMSCNNLSSKCKTPFPHPNDGQLSRVMTADRESGEDGDTRLPRDTG